MLDRTVAPKSFLLDDLALADVTVKQLSNGILVHQFIDDTNPVIKIDFLFPFGKAIEEKAGLATLCVRLMMEATLSYSSKDLQETLDHYGAHIDASVENDDTSVSLLCLKEHINLLLPVIKSVLTEPLFEKDDFDKLKFKMIQKARINNEKNGFLATKFLKYNLLKNTPYALVADEDTLSSIILSDTKTFYNQYLKTRPQIIIAGDFDTAVGDEVEVLLGMMEFKEASALKPVTPEPDYSVQEIKREGSVQASIRLGALCIDKSHPDYFKLAIANEILGGYFGSRLMKNIREDKGYTYGIYSSIVNYKGVSYHIIGADVKLDAVDDAIQECKNELAAMQQIQITDDELSTVKNYMLGKLAGHLDTIFSQSDNYKSKVAEGIDYKRYFNDYVKAIRGITPKDVQEVSKKYFSEKYSVVKVVG